MLDRIASTWEKIKRPHPRALNVIIWQASIECVHVHVHVLLSVCSKVKDRIAHTVICKLFHTALQSYPIEKKGFHELWAIDDDA